MEGKNQSSLKEQQERRKRINRIKRGLISFIGIWMLLCMFLCVVLLSNIISNVYLTMPFFHCSFHKYPF